MCLCAVHCLEAIDGALAQAPVSTDGYSREHKERQGHALWECSLLNRLQGTRVLNGNYPIVGPHRIRAGHTWTQIKDDDLGVSNLPTKAQVREVLDYVVDARFRRHKRELEPLFSKWEKKWHDDGGKDINNPKVPLDFVVKHGTLLYGEPPDLKKTRLGKTIAVIEGKEVPPIEIGEED